LIDIRAATESNDKLKETFPHDFQLKYTVEVGFIFLSRDKIERSAENLTFALFRSSQEHPLK